VPNQAAGCWSSLIIRRPDQYAINHRLRLHRCPPAEQIIIRRSFIHFSALFPFNAFGADPFQSPPGGKEIDSRQLIVNCSSGRLSVRPSHSGTEGVSIYRFQDVGSTEMIICAAGADQ